MLSYTITLVLFLHISTGCVNYFVELFILTKQLGKEFGDCLKSIKACME